MNNLFIGPLVTQGWNNLNTILIKKRKGSFFHYVKNQLKINEFLRFEF